jgi:hypothetical protein
MGGRYTLEDARDLDLDRVSDYCRAMSFRSLGDLAPSVAPLVRSAMERPPHIPWTSISDSPSSTSRSRSKPRAKKTGLR